jgi:hypothetical protein
MKTCRGCGESRPLADFGADRRNKDGLMAVCRPCQNARSLASKRRIPRDQLAERERRTQLKMRYGTTPEEYEAMERAQDGVCAICYRPNPGRRMAVDHDHRTGRVRGLLCDPCNLGIGKLGDNSDRLRAAAMYLDRYAEKESA